MSLRRADYSVVVTAGIETDRVSPEWILKTGQGVDKLIVPSNHAKAGFETTSYSFKNEATGETGKLSCACPIEVVPYPVKEIEPADLDLELDTEFNFLNVALLGPRKNLENSVEWFLEEFKNDDNVGLILKTARSRSSVLDKHTLEHLQNIVKDTKIVNAKSISCMVICRARNPLALQSSKNQRPGNCHLWRGIWTSNIRSSLFWFTYCCY